MLGTSLQRLYISKHKTYGTVPMMFIFYQYFAPSGLGTLLLMPMAVLIVKFALCLASFRVSLITKYCAFSSNPSRF